MNAAGQEAAACLTRTSADDRAEAREQSDYDDPGVDRAIANETAHAALAAIQRREAEAVLSLAPTIHVSSFTLPRAAAEAAKAAVIECTDDRLPLDQRAIVLDAARALVAVARDAR